MPAGHTLTPPPACMGGYPTYLYDVTDIARFFRKVAPQPSGCWHWTAYTYDGYGNFRVGGRARKCPDKAHRVVYEMLVGPIPAGLTLDHLCRNRACVNPAHLEPVTGVENWNRGNPHTGKTHCPYGHPYDEENTGYSANAKKTGTQRYCKTCSRRRAAERRTTNARTSA